MHPEIAAFPSARVYGGRALQTDPSMLSRRAWAYEPSKPRARWLHVTGPCQGRQSQDEADAVKILFLDEVQDLPRTVQRKLVRVLQDRHRRYSPVGSDEERVSDFEVVCASNRSLSELQGLLDADLFDRLSHLVVTIPPLRDCRDDLLGDWREVWREL